MVAGLLMLVPAALTNVVLLQQGPSRIGGDAS
jgi:hypothetical protein